MEKNAENNELIKTSIYVNRADYEEFKKMCKKNDSDVAKEFRKFIKEYLNKNK